MLVHATHADPPIESAASTMLLIFVGIHNAWDVVTYLAID